MDLTTLRGLRWSKDFSGSWTLFECSYYGEQATVSLKRRLGVGIQHSLYIFRKGVIAGYIVEDEVEKFGKAMARRLSARPSLAKQWAGQTKRQADRIFNFLRKVKSRPITLENNETLWTLQEEFFLANWPIKQSVNYLPNKILVKILPILEKVRKYGEPVYATTNIFVKKLAEQLARGARIKPHFILCMTRDELSHHFRHKKLPQLQELRLRYRGSALVFKNKQMTLIRGSEADKLENWIVRASTRTDVIKGQIAYRGKVKGRVRIVSDPSRVRRYQPGSILVTGMTRPEYLPLMKQSNAIVTDAGGVLSHAAITARELKIPTIIGTETATKTLKNGDLIEVDANRGEVRILRR